MGIVININLTDGMDVVRSSETKGLKQKEKIENHFISLVGMTKAKKDKLLHYTERDAKEFFQFDAFTAIGDGDDIIRPDDDGDCLCSGTTTELMFGADVRVLVAPDTSKIEAIRVLKKIKEWIDKDPSALSPKKFPGYSVELPF